MAWLNAVPSEKFNKDSKKSRAELYGKDNPVCILPDCDEVLRNAFFTCGAFQSGGMSIAPISWAEIRAYSQMTCSNLSAWESETLMMMSREYCSFSSKAKEWNCVQPYWHDMTEEQQEEYNASLERLTSETEKQRDCNGKLIE